MPKNHRPPRSEQIQIPVPIRVIQVRTLRTSYKRRVAPNRTKRTHGRVHATRKKLFCTKLKLTGVSKNTGHTVKYRGDAPATFAPPGLVYFYLHRLWPR